MRLALLMGRPVEQLAREMSSAELTDWLAYDRVFGLPDPWLQTGVIAATTRNGLAAKGKAIRPEAFIPADRAGRAVRQSPRQIRSIVRRIAAAYSEHQRKPDGR